MDIIRTGTVPEATGPAEWFTGWARLTRFATTSERSRVNGSNVTFQPGARTVWHTHPLGQLLIVTAGVGRVGRWDGPVDEIRPGDMVWIAPDEKHWHGAAPESAMSHIAIHEALDGEVVTWMEHVSDDQYGG